jgi:hypothetical protein
MGEMDPTSLVYMVILFNPLHTKKTVRTLSEVMSEVQWLTDKCLSHQSLKPIKNGVYLTMVYSRIYS